MKEIVQNHIESIEHISNQQVVAYPLIKGLPPSVFEEHTVDMGLWEAYVFRTIKDPKLKNLSQNRDVYYSC